MCSRTQSFGVRVFYIYKRIIRSYKISLTPSIKYSILNRHIYTAQRPLFYTCCGKVQQSQDLVYKISLGCLTEKVYLNLGGVV